MYILLTGKPPFGGKDNQQILTKVKKGEFSMSNKIFEYITEEAKDLLKKLLTYNP